METIKTEQSEYIISKLNMLNLSSKPPVAPVYLHSMAFSRDLNVFGRLLRKFCILFKASIAVPECK